MSKVKWALIGCGKVVLKNKRTPFINRNNTIISICTTDIKHSKKAIKSLNIKNCRAYDNAKIMVENEKIDAIYICTPPKFHYYYLRLLYKYNIPVIYVEKPFTISYDEAEEISKLYDFSKSTIFVAHYKRITKQFKTLKKTILKYGHVSNIEGTFYRVFDINLANNSWIYNTEISGGGRFFDIAPHIFDTLYYLFGEFTEIKSVVKYSKILKGCESYIEVNAKINDVKCHLVFDMESSFEEDKIDIYCDNKVISTSINRDQCIYIHDNSNILTKKIRIHKSKVWGIEAIKEIDKYLNNKLKNNLSTVDDALKIQRYIHNILKQGK